MLISVMLFLVSVSFHSKIQKQFAVAPSSRFCTNTIIHDPTTTNDDQDHNNIDDEEYRRVTISSRNLGLTKEVLERSRAHVGNRWRLARLNQILENDNDNNNHTAEAAPVNIVVCGGSISLGHGISPHTERYSDQLERWLNDMYPIPSAVPTRKHRVHNMGSHGADVRMILYDIVKCA